MEVWQSSGVEVTVFGPILLTIADLLRRFSLVSQLANWFRSITLHQTYRKVACNLAQVP